MLQFIPQKILLIKGAVFMEKRLVIQKDNHIIQNTMNKFSYKQNQLMCVLLGKYVHTKNNECIDTTITINELRQALGLNDCSDNYKQIQKAVSDFGKNGSIATWEEVKAEVWDWVWMPFFKKIKLSHNKVEFIWNDEMKGHLINLKNKYTAYLASDYLKLNSVYSQNLYEQMKSYQNIPNHPQVTFSVADLHRIMQTEKVKNYQTFNKFKTKCIEPAINDINANTDIFVVIEVVRNEKDKRKADGIAFTIHSDNEKFSYIGCWLNADEINEIIYKHKAKDKIVDLAEIKANRKDYYTLLRQGNKSDYQIIMNFINQDKLKSGERELSEEDLRWQTVARTGNLQAMDYCHANGILY